MEAEVAQAMEKWEDCDGLVPADYRIQFMQTGRAGILKCSYIESFSVNSKNIFRKGGIRWKKRDSSFIPH